MIEALQSVNMWPKNKNLLRRIIFDLNHPVYSQEYVHLHFLGLLGTRDAQRAVVGTSSPAETDAPSGILIINTLYLIKSGKFKQLKQLVPIYNFIVQYYFTL